MSHHGPARHYRVDGHRFDTFDAAAGRAVAIGVQRSEHVAIVAFERGRVVKIIDVTAALSNDKIPTTDNDPTEEG